VRLPQDWKWYEFSLAGAAVMLVMTSVHFVAAIPRLWVEPWTWKELLLLPVEVVAIGLACGTTIGLLRPLHRWGLVGDAIIGAIAADIYLLACFLVFNPEDLQHPPLKAVVALGLVAACGGGLFAVGIQLELRQESRAAAAAVNLSTANSEEEVSNSALRRQTHESRPHAGFPGDG
jgi:hypothetical protein